jgi:hypothetical protein
MRLLELPEASVRVLPSVNTHGCCGRVTRAAVAKAKGPFHWSIFLFRTCLSSCGIVRVCGGPRGRAYRGLPRAHACSAHAPCPALHARASMHAVRAAPRLPCVDHSNAVLSWRVDAHP